MKFPFSPIAAILLVASSSVFANQIIVDTKGVDETQYHADLYECEQYAQQVKPEEVDSLGSDIVGSTAKGAALGAVGGAVSGGSGHDGAKIGAGIGIISGALKHGAQKRQSAELSEQQKFQVNRNCMINRGYTVLN
ncbi:glycine zipper family protein [Vibrio sp. 10N.222.51.C8]|uniref:glycine zipper family protein n=1 Tax=Vibrio TaxID=662 RepID=UPI0002E29786|nr:MULTISPECIES: glycine zipper family protein [Vibrio]MCC4891367.1 glycine zipper family protein [Vibrio sp. F13]